MTNVTSALIRSDSEQARRHFREDTGGYGRLSVSLLPRILRSNEFYTLSDTKAFDNAVPGLEAVHISGGFAVAVTDQVEALARFLRAELVTKARGMCLIEDILARRGDKYLGVAGCDVRYVDESVFYVLTSRDEEPNIERCVRKSRITFGHSLCILVDEVSLGDVSSSLEWTATVFEGLVESASWAVMSSRGGEAFLLANLT